MRIPRLVPLVLLLVGCSGSDDTVGPGGDDDSPPAIEFFLVTNGTLTHGEWTQLRWRVTGANSVTIAPDVGVVSSPAGGAASVRPYRSASYVLTAENAKGSATASVDVQVEYPVGVWVSSVAGDDANTGGSPLDPIRTLGEALARTQGGGAIFLSAGDYDVAVVVDGAERTIFGGLNPATFFEESEIYETWVRPTGGGVPLIVRNSPAGTSFFSFVKFDARHGGEVAADVQGSRVILEDCLLDGRFSGSGTALRIQGSSDVEVRRCRIFGGRRTPGTVHTETRGVAVLDASSLTMNACFVDGGQASSRVSGVDVATTGTVRLGFNTVSGYLSGTSGTDVCTAVRMRGGRPALGGNIFSTWGSGRRHALYEEAAGAEPSWLFGNLFVSAGTPPYKNYDGDDPTNEEQLNTGSYINGDDTTVYGNRLVPSSTSIQELLVNWNSGDYHLVSVLPSGGPNPAVDRGDALFLNGDLFGPPGPDIDGEARPGIAAQHDLGADEL